MGSCRYDTCKEEMYKVHTITEMIKALIDFKVLVGAFLAFMIPYGLSLFFNWFAGQYKKK